MTTIAIRPYRPTDRPAVRDICYRTGYMGDPIASQWADRPSFANLFSSYYTDREPESALVAERDNSVVGYLLGCRETERSTSPTRIFFAQIFTRFIAIRPGTARFVRRSVVDTLVDLARRDSPPDRFIDPRWPAHLHINLLPEARGEGVGRDLIHQWLDRLALAHAAGCHLEVVGENVSAIAFFKSCGFKCHGSPAHVPGLRAPNGSRHHLQLMVRSLEPARSIGKST